jgi:hypothetical protein
MNRAGTMPPGLEAVNDGPLRSVKGSKALLHRPGAVHPANILSARTPGEYGLSAAREAAGGARLLTVKFGSILGKLSGIRRAQIAFPVLTISDASAYIRSFGAPSA